MSATKVVTDTNIVMMRELRPLLRDQFSLVFSMIQPLFFLCLFGPLLARAVDVPGGGSVWQWFVPGILVMTALFGTSMTGSNLLYEMQTGSHERMLVTPLSRSALLVGRALKEIVPLVAQAALIVVVMIPFGFDLYPAGAVTGLVLLAVFGVGLGALSYSLAIACKNQDWIFWTVQQTLIFPLLILSGMLLPLDNAPGWMDALSRLNPLTHIVEAERSLFSGDFNDFSVLAGIVSAALVAAVGLWVGTRMMRRATV